MWGRIVQNYTGMIELLLDGGSFNIPNRTKVTNYENFELFSKSLTSFMNERAKNGYYVIDFSENFPLKSWLVNHNEILTNSKFQQNLDLFT